ncbi:MAG TPA: hypothetical protein VFV63_07205, partial [Ilumatobacteraceae bacterium]|nr:hypothetical protein [Ilumatobacteraceae bacterium]
LRHDVTHHTALAMLCEAAGALGRSDVAGAVAPLLESFADRRIVTNVYGGGGLCWGSVAHQLGICAATTGEIGAALHWFEVALEHHRNDGAVPFEARTQARLAELAQPAPR